MPQTRMFRDRVVSMEQTLEGGEKNLEFLKAICREALPEFEYKEHFLDHERDVFVIALEAADGRRKRVCWTRMVLFDAERLPALVENPVSPLRSRILAYLQARVARPEIVVTFRHLEDGWVDTPEPRREKRRGRRGGRDGRARQPAAGASGPPQPGRDGGAQRERERKGGRGGRPERGRDGGRQRQRGAISQPAARDSRNPTASAPAGAPTRPASPASAGGTNPARPPQAPGEPGAAEAVRPGGRRRRFRRRRRGRGGAGGDNSGQGPRAGGSPGGGGPSGGGAGGGSPAGNS